MHLRMRYNNYFSVQYPSVVRGLAKLPNDTVLDGEVVALDEEGRRINRGLHPGRAAIATDADQNHERRPIANASHQWVRGLYNWHLAWGQLCIGTGQSRHGWRRRCLSRSRSQLPHPSSFPDGWFRSLTETRSVC